MTGSHFKRIGVGALAVAALSLTACGSAASGGGGASGGSSRRQRHAEPDADHRL